MRGGERERQSCANRFCPGGEGTRAGEIERGKQGGTTAATSSTRSKTEAGRRPSSSSSSSWANRIDESAEVRRTGSTLFPLFWEDGGNLGTRTVSAGDDHSELPGESSLVCRDAPATRISQKEDRWGPKEEPGGFPAETVRVPGQKPPAARKEWTRMITFVYSPLCHLSLSVCPSMQ